MLFLSRRKEDRSGIVQEALVSVCARLEPHPWRGGHEGDFSLCGSFLWILKWSCFSMKTC